MGRPWRGAGRPVGRPGRRGRGGGFLRRDGAGAGPGGEGRRRSLGARWVGGAARPVPRPAYGAGGRGEIRVRVGRGHLCSYEGERRPRAHGGGRHGRRGARSGRKRRTRPASARPPPGLRLASVPAAARGTGRSARARSRSAELPAHEAHFTRLARRTVTYRTGGANSLTQCDRRAARPAGTGELRKVSGMMIRKSCGRRGGWRRVSPGSLVQFGPWDLCAIRSGRFPPPSTGDGGCFCCPRSPCWPC